jgi:hypothetical protein
VAAATTVANDGVAPDGTTTADKVVSTGGGVFRAGAGVANSTAYTYSVFLKHVAGTGVVSTVGFERFGSTPLAGTSSFNLLTGAIVNGAAVQSSSITRYPNNWYRVSVTATSTDVTTTVVNYAAASGNEFLIWGAQLEAGSFHTSYMPTTTAAVTRSADVASISGSNFSSWYRQDEGTVFSQYFPNAVAPATSAQVLFVVSNNSSTDRTYLAKRANADQSTRWASNKTGATDVSFINAGTWLADNSKIAAAYKVNDYAASLNGATSVTDTTVDLFTAMTQINIGSDHTGALPLNGTLRRLTYWPQRLPNSTLQQITQ